MNLCLKCSMIGLLCAAALASLPVHAQSDWGEVFVASREFLPSVRSNSVDTMVLPDGTPVVGYQTTPQSAALSFVEANAPRSVDLTDLTRFSRFESDRFGIISYATTYLSGPSYGTDYGSRTATDSEDRFEMDGLVDRRAPADIALNNAGVPTIVGRSPNGSSYVLSSFDIPQGAWAVKAIPSSIGSETAFSINTVAKYTDDNRLVIAGVSQYKFELLVEQAGDSFYTFSTGGLVDFGASIATAGDEVAFAFEINNSTTVGILGDAGVAYEQIPSDRPIAPGALAYTPDGTLSMAYADQTTGEIILAQRTAPGTWDTEPTGFSSADRTTLSLAFADDGTPYIGVGDDGFVSLLSTAFPAYVPGDMDGSGGLTNGDIAPFVLALTDPTGFAKEYPDIDPSEVGDFSGDGNFTNGDINGFVAALTGGGSVQAAELSVVPEPGSMALLSIGAFAFARRRR